MKKKYNLALVPVSQTNSVIALAKKFTNIADKYILGENSLPHVTLYHFHAEEKEIDRIWKEVCNVWKEKQLYLRFDHYSCGIFNNIFWISLLPDNMDNLHQLHALVANILGLPIKETFDPHMTLINTKNTNYDKEAALIFNSYEPIKDMFALVLGKSDDVGQLVNIINQFKTAS